jgi:membrane-bound ClpP family serine protease
MLQLVGFAVVLAHIVHPPCGRRLLGFAIAGIAALLFILEGAYPDGSGAEAAIQSIQLVVYLLVIVLVRFFEAFSREVEKRRLEALSRSEEA